MTKKFSKVLCLFLFAAGFGAAMTASATDDACYSTCLLKYEDCKTKPWLSAGYCSYRFQTCIAACDGTTPGA
jgi:hypothetical protein